MLHNPSALGSLILLQIAPKEQAQRGVNTFGGLCIVLQSQGSARCFREQWNMTINVLETWKQKENKTGKTRTRAYFRELEKPKSKKYFHVI